MPDCLGLVWYRTCSGIVSFFYSGTGLFGCRTVGHSNIYTHEHAHEHAHKHALAQAHTPMMCGMNTDRNMDVQHGYEAWTWTCTMDMEMDKHHGCRNTDKKFSLASLVSRQFITLSPASAFRHCGQSGTASQGLVRQCTALLMTHLSFRRTIPLSVVVIIP